jgi:hypothetical protein
VKFVADNLSHPLDYIASYEVGKLINSNSPQTLPMSSARKATHCSELVIPVSAPKRVFMLALGKDVPLVHNIPIMSSRRRLHRFALPTTLEWR